MFDRLRLFHVFFLLALLQSCNSSEFSKLTEAPKSFFQSKIASQDLLQLNPVEISNVPLNAVLQKPNASVDVSKGFKLAIRQAVQSDPQILSKQAEIKAQAFKIAAKRADKDFRVTGAIYGGIEDLTDETTGVALVLNANRMIYDGGSLDASIASSEFSRSASLKALVSQKENLANELSSAWIDLERYETLSEKIQSRLNVLQPLIKQLEKVADAGVGDVTQVSAAQRTVYAIRATQADVLEKLEQSRVNFFNAFGESPEGVTFDHSFISSLVPDLITEDMIYSSPAVLVNYKTYQAAEANLALVRAKDQLNLNFESRLTRPFGDSGFDSDEQIGLVLRKTLFNGDQSSIEAEQAQAQVTASREKVLSTFRLNKKTIKSAEQNITTMKRNIELARDNAKVSADEILYLRQQLVIGGSTLDSVLSAEARLYEAEAKEINFTASKLKSELLILSTLGLLVPAYNL